MMFGSCWHKERCPFSGLSCLYEREMRDSCSNCHSHNSRFSLVFVFPSTNRRKGWCAALTPPFLSVPNYLPCINTLSSLPDSPLYQWSFWFSMLSHSLVCFGFTLLWIICVMCLSSPASLLPICFCPLPRWYLCVQVLNKVLFEITSTLRFNKSWQ